MTSQAEAELASRFASVGILIYTASFAVLETGVMLVVLAWKVKEYFDRKAEEDRERIMADREQIMAEGRAEGRAEGEAIALARRREAERLGMETTDSVDVIYQRLRDEGWQPTQA